MRLWGPRLRTTDIYNILRTQVAYMIGCFQVKKPRISNPPEDARFSAREVIFVHADEVPMETEHEHAAIADIGENTQGFHILLEAAQMKADGAFDFSNPF